MIDMEEYKSMTATLTDIEQTIYINSSGIIIKSILLQATTTNKQATLKFDGVAFNFNLNEETTVISTPIMTKSIKGSGSGINVHITALHL